MIRSGIENAELRICDLLGRELAFIHHAQGEITFGKEFIPGIYFVEISFGSEKQVMKIVKE